MPRVVVAVVLLLSCSSEGPSPADAGAPVPCATSAECPEGYRCALDSRRQADPVQDWSRFTFGAEINVCLPACEREQSEACALPACEPWTEDQLQANRAELERQMEALPYKPGESIGYYPCDDGSRVIVSWTCGFTRGFASASDDNPETPPAPWRPWNRRDVDACAYFFPEPGSEPGPWPFTF